MKKSTKVEYIWIDGQCPTAKMRSKTRILPETVTDLSDIPDWNFDGSSTQQQNSHYSDCRLKPVRAIKDPLRGEPHLLVLCEVYDHQTDNPHPTNTRAHLSQITAKHKKAEPWFGVEQEYTMYDDRGVNPLDWPTDGHAYPEPQGRYYCGVGADEVSGRQLIEKHTEACLEAGLALSGTNMEVMLAQSEFQLEALPALEQADQLWLARWLLYRIGEDLNITIKLDPKPIGGDWNGAGAHTNFSTREMREKSQGGLDSIKKVCQKLADNHQEHLKVYGAYNDERLTGEHETCHYSQFAWNVADRGVSVRIPAGVAKAEEGYLEDRRPAANMDPYQVFSALIETAETGKFNAEPFSYFWKRWKFWMFPEEI